MHNIWLIAKREYTERVRTRGFMIATILIPLLMTVGIAGTRSGWTPSSRRWATRRRPTPLPLNLPPR